MSQIKRLGGLFFHEFFTSPAHYPARLSKNGEVARFADGCAVKEKGAVNGPFQTTTARYASVGVDRLSTEYGLHNFGIGDLFGFALLDQTEQVAI